MVIKKDSETINDTVTTKDARTTDDFQVATPYNFSPDDAVTLIVGVEQKRMLVHSTYLTRDSDFFKAALKKEWSEGETRMIKLPEEDPELMAHYLTFVYHYKLPFKGVAPKDRGDYTARWWALVDLYVYGERFLHRPIQNAVIKEILRLTRLKDSNGGQWFPCRRLVDRMYRGTPDGSPGRRLMVDLHIIKGDKSWLHDNSEPQFTTDLTKAFYDMMELHDNFGDFREKELKAKDYM